MERSSRELAYAEAGSDLQVKEANIHAVPEFPIVSSKRNFYFIVKRVLDALLSALALVVLSPVFLIVAIVVKLEDGGPVIHTRYCVGKNNTIYKMYKFRTMVVDADNYDHYLTPYQQVQLRQEQKVENDPRITKIGHLLRKTSLDELPQLVSILKGDMSIVGPRPIVEAECHHYGKDLPRLFSARPGLTGLWQVSGRSNCTYASGERQRLELYYAQNVSFALDISILLRTVKVVLKGSGAH